jgi:aspartyl-tRNA(Asn)/glutamyl-tRNA(Gln) amidotransferase subunit B
VEAAIDYEIARQIEVLEGGNEVIQETRGWDEAKQITTTQRGKEEAHDYRYFPDPDLPPVELTDEMLTEIEKSVPILPPAIRAELARLSLEPQVVEDVLEHTDEMPKLLEIIKNAGENAGRRAAFWLLETGRLDPERDIELSAMVEHSEISSSAAKAVREAMLTSSESPSEIAERLNLKQVSDTSELEAIVVKILEDNPKAVEDIKNGEVRAIGFLVGQAMKATGGKANPGVVQQIIKSKIGI